MSTTETFQIYTAQPIMLPILPATSAPLAETFNVNASYSTSLGKLSVIMSFMIPSSIPASEVTIKQFYNPEQPTKLIFYAVYNTDSSGAYTQVNCQFNASSVDASGNAINLAGILNIVTMVYCMAGPRSSRGTAATVRVSGE